MSDYQEYLEELERVKREQCKSGDHNWTTAYPHHGTRPYCTKCGVES